MQKRQPGGAGVDLLPGDHAPLTTTRIRKPILCAPAGARLRLQAIRFALFLGRVA